MKKIFISLVLCTNMVTAHAVTNAKLPGVDKFINKMVATHQFDKQELTSLFSKVEPKNSIVKAISRPAEKSIPWHKYRKIFLKDKQINGGVQFWQQHAEALNAAENKYGIPAKIIVAILGVETRYGGNVGSYRVIDALSTLAFKYPPRSKFFTSELEHFLLLTREENMSQLSPLGSYAGAMGLGQFMPSSYREYAVDFDEDGQRDIWTNPTDAIGSIANYLKRHGWVEGKSIAHRTRFSGDVPTALVKKGYKPSFTRANLREKGVSLTTLPEGQDKIALISLTQQQGEEYWLVRKNFYAITRYNHSRMYAMAVTQLAKEIQAKYMSLK